MPFFRGAKGDYAPVIDSAVLSRLRRAEVRNHQVVAQRRIGNRGGQVFPRQFPAQHDKILGRDQPGRAAVVSDRNRRAPRPGKSPLQVRQNWRPCRGMLRRASSACQRLPPAAPRAEESTARQSSVTMPRSFPSALTTGSAASRQRRRRRTASPAGSSGRSTPARGVITSRATAPSKSLPGAAKFDQASSWSSNWP